MAEILGVFEQVILLCVVRLGEDAYGRSVFRGVEQSLGDHRTVAAGAVYTTLDRLEAKGLVRSKLGEGTPERGGRRRRFYRITASGMRALKEARRTLESVWNTIQWPIEVPR